MQASKQPPPTAQSTLLPYDSNLLFEFRKWCTNDSLFRAKERLKEEKLIRQEITENIAKIKAERQGLYERASSCMHVCTQIGSERPLSYVSFSPDSKQISVASWGGHCNIFDAQDLRQLSGHILDSERLCCVEYNPRQHSYPYIMSAGNMSGKIYLFYIGPDGSKENIKTLEGHLDRVSRVAFHPSGNYLASASFDTTWRLWDLEHPSIPQLLIQEGHSKQVYCIDFHRDGALVATGGLDSSGIVWDIRSGRPIYTLKGHSQSILGINFAPNGYELATGSEDSAIKIWDLRQLKNTQTIAAHSNIITCVKFSANNSWLLSTSHDQTAKIWGSYDWRLLSTMSHSDSDSPRGGMTNSNKVMHGAINRDSDRIVTVSYDRTVRLWKVPT